jgi:hypothetical protein
LSNGKSAHTEEKNSTPDWNMNKELKPLTILPLDLEQRQEKKIKHEEKSDLVACTLKSMEPFSWSMQSHTRKGITDLIVCY